MERKWKVAFLEKQNTCKSLIAEAIAKKISSDVMEVYSAGMEEGKDLCKQAVRVLKETHGIDLENDAYSPKLISELPKVDIVIYLDGGIRATSIPGQIEMAWELLNFFERGEKSDEEFKKIISIIENNLIKLQNDIISGRVNQWKKENVLVDFANVFPFWNELTDKQRMKFNASWRIEIYGKNCQLYSATQERSGIMLVRKGSLRVYMISEEGREVTLYRVFPGGVCVLSAANLLDEIDFDVLIEASEESEVLKIPAVELAPIMAENVALEVYLYKKTAECFSECMWTMQQVLFKRIDQKIARYLWDVSIRESTTIIMATHDEIARDIGSAREVVTKTVKHMVGDGLIKSGHSKVEIVDKDGLYALL